MECKDYDIACVCETNIWKLFRARDSLISNINASHRINATNADSLWYSRYWHCFDVNTVNLWYSNWTASSEFVSSSILSWQILTAHAQPFRGARNLAFCLKVPLDSLLVWASSGVSGETARMHRLAWTFATRICDKYQIHLTWPNCGSVKCVCIFHSDMHVYFT